jgi:antitoxin component YwqK of YwqJK toxin-antitoxin module
MLRISEGQMELGFYISGNEKDGIFVRYDRKGNLLLRTKHREGRSIGEYLVWWPTGELKIRKVFSETGTEISEELYTKKGVRVFDSNKLKGL